MTDVNSNNNTCVQCGGIFLGGEKPHEMRVKYGNEPWHIELYCADCIDWYSECLWDDESRGPYHSRFNRSAPPGHA